MNQVLVSVQGMVQGVCFRAWTMDLAARLDLKGWVRNTPDGSVEILAQGKDTSLKKLIELLREGPVLARVSRVDAEHGVAKEKFDKFSVKY